MSKPAWVLDTGALMAYVHGVAAVGDVVVDAADAGETVAIPLVCLLEAYSLLDHTEHDVLRVLRLNASVNVVEPRFDVVHADDCPVIGDMARAAGRLGAGHAAYVAVTSPAAVVTSRPDQIRAVIGGPWEILEV